MPTYAFLRAVNVGGRFVRMAAVRSAVEAEAGFAMSRDRLCTVTRTLLLPTEVESQVD